MGSNAQNPGQADVPEELRRFAADFDPHFSACLHATEEVPVRLASAIAYSALARGKRIRPYLVVECCKLVGGDHNAAWKVASAVECVHVFSLIHDDLPAMDDDPVRRGQPTCHIQFDEATAILAGDALLARAFELLTENPTDERLACRAVHALAVATGGAGMIGGQMDDITGEDQPASIELTRSIHLHKTARLLEASCYLGALVGGGEATQQNQLGRFGRHLGICFQITDDLLDLSGSIAEVGKPTQKDQAAQKQTYPRCAGPEEARKAATAFEAAAITELAGFGCKADALRRVAQFVARRSF